MNIVYIDHIRSKYSSTYYEILILKDYENIRHFFCNNPMSNFSFPLSLEQLSFHKKVNMYEICTEEAYYKRINEIYKYYIKAIRDGEILKIFLQFKKEILDEFEIFKFLNEKYSQLYCVKCNNNVLQNTGLIWEDIDYIYIQCGRCGSLTVFVLEQIFNLLFSIVFQ